MYKLPEELKRTLEQVIRSSYHPNVPFDDVLKVLSQVRGLDKVDDEAEDGDE